MSDLAQSIHTASVNNGVLGLQSRDYKTHVTTIFTSNKLTDAQASLKQIAKLLQGINSTPKSRQIPVSGFIVKKFILGVAGGKELLMSLGFTESTIHTTQYFTLADQHPTIEASNQIAAELLAIASTNPTKTSTTESTEMSDAAAASTDTDTAATSTTMNDNETIATKEKSNEEAKEEKDDAAAAPPQKCSKGCGFYANASSSGMCSSCYKSEQRTAAKPADIIVPGPTGAAVLKRPLINVRRPLMAKPQRPAGFCETPHCPFGIWAQAPATWKADLVKGLEERRGTDLKMGEEEDAQPSSEPQQQSITQQPITQDPAEPTTQAEKCCQYCAISQVQSDFYKTHKKTPLEKKQALSAKVQSLGVMASLMRRVQDNKDRCWTCNRKLGLSGVDCRCGFIFCGQHRYPQTHACTYDHMARYTSNLAKSTLNDITKNKLEDDSD